MGRGPGSGSERSLGERLARARRRGFVGRRAELELFRRGLAAPGRDWAVLFLHGPGGVGKSTLLDAFAETAAEDGVEATRIDMRAVDPSPAAFEAALGGAEPRLLLIDTYEAAGPLDPWLRESLLPRLPAAALVVIAGRRRPDPAWMTDPGWREVTRVVSLRNLEREDALALLEAAGVGGEAGERALRLTHGHPLALSVLVDLWRQGRLGGELPADLGEAPDILPPLLERFLTGVPTERHREALQVCAHTQFTTEPLLRAALGGADAAELFGWLRGLSFVDEGPRGLFPHDLARDVLEADLRWRDPDRHADLHGRVRAHLRDRLLQSEGAAQHRAAADIVFLHRANPVVRPLWDWDSFGSAYADRPRPGDREAVLAMVERHEGGESAALAERWLALQPQGFTVMRAGEREPIGFAAVIALHAADPADIEADPGTRAMWEYAQRFGPPRPGEEVHAARFLVDREAYQRPSPTQNLVTVVHTQHLIAARRPAWDFIGAYTDPESVRLMLEYIDYHRAPEADYDVGGLRYGVFAHDWRRRGQEDWLDLMAEREIGHGFGPAAAERPAPMLALPRDQFAAAVREALRDLHRPERLATSPLLRSRLVGEAEEGRPGPEALRELLTETVEQLGEDPRDEKLRRALDRTYLRPAQTQEMAAEVLGLPFSTYRRHLGRGIERVVERLWQRELYG